MFNPFKRLLHRKEFDEFDSGDVRSHVLGEKFNRYDDFSGPKQEYEPPAPPPRFDKRSGPDTKFDSRFASEDDFSPKTKDVFDSFPVERDLPQNERPLPQQHKSKDFEILDRLDIMESTLSAIRSQTETINERLKNLESKMGYGRRY